MGIRIHPRTRQVAVAKAEIKQEFLRLAVEKGLTAAEMFGLLGELVTETAAYEVRMERHGTYEKKGDEA